MRSNYKKIGDFIQLVDERNKDLKVTTLLGLSITKEFIQSVANTIGTDMENYKIIRKNQFACSTMQVRRDKKIPVALLKDYDEAIISPAYPVFEIADTSKLLPEYLMMWMSRTEFDREACFYAIGGVRGSLEWVDFCDMKLPVPTIDKQKEIIKEYNVLANRITLNNQLNQKLEEIAQSIYKQWFVDFEFPDENGKPYKSNGGEMIESEMGEIPKGWCISNLPGIATYLNGLAMQNFKMESIEFIPVVKIRELSQGFTDESSDKAAINIPDQYVITDGDVIFSWSGTLNVQMWTGGIGGLNQHLFKVTSNKYERWFYYLWTCFHLQDFIRIAEGKATSLGHIKREHLDSAKVLIPIETQLNEMNRIMIPIFNLFVNLKTENRHILCLSKLVLSKMTTQMD